ncbi:MAG TPA: RICIN domain-containing protein, partial [Methylocella sp.]|nr:RICIN domain-containing protein [Methylocella sp.]
MNKRLLLITLILITATPAAATMLVNSASKYCLDTDGVAANGGNVRMWRCVKHPNQGWRVIERSGIYSFRNNASSFCLDTDGARANGAQVRIWGCVNHPNQLWEMIKLPTG